MKIKYNKLKSAKDTSKKNKAVFKAKGESGKPLCINPPYGYVKEPDDKHHWIVEETAANVVKRIFNHMVQVRLRVFLKRIKCLCLLLTTNHWVLIILSLFLEIHMRDNQERSQIFFHIMNI